MARGPAYPYVALGEAVELLRKLHTFAKRSPAMLDSVAKEAWGWSPTSSTPKKASAALKYFGLTEEAGKEGNAIRVSDRGYRILVDSPESPERIKALQNAALSPAQYAYCFKEWGADVPQSARSSLIFARGFVPSTVDGFLKDYKASMTYAGLDQIVNRAESEETDDDIATAISGVELPEQTRPALMATQAPPSIVIRAANEGAAMRQYVFSIDEGAVTIQWPTTLSKDSLKDVEDWLEIVKRKIARSLKEVPSDNDDES